MCLTVGQARHVANAFPECRAEMVAFVKASACSGDLQAERVQQ